MQHILLQCKRSTNPLGRGFKAIKKSDREEEEKLMIKTEILF